MNELKQEVMEEGRVLSKMMNQEYVPVTVSQITNEIKYVLEGKYNNVLVQGEVSNYKKHTSGHVYFSLIEGDCLLQCVCWKSIKIPELLDGMSIICSGKITAYTGRSQFQLVVTSISIAGKGNLFKLFEELKVKLEKEGLFALERKRIIKAYPKHIGIITAATGDALQDILIRLKERVSCKITIWSVPVQGAPAPLKIAQAIGGFALLQDKPDVLILARGGGSMEDLWAFNDEVTVRAVSNSAIPTVTAIGHEMDVTLVDYVSDKRAPTPTASIEMLLPKRTDLLTKLIKVDQIITAIYEKNTKHAIDQLQLLTEHAQNLLSNFYLQKVQKLDYLAEKIEIGVKNIFKIHQNNLPQLVSLSSIYALNKERIDVLEKRLNINNVYNKHVEMLKQFEALLDSVSYEKVLQRGFCLAFDQDGNAITDGDTAKRKKELSIQFSDQSINVSCKM